jgi:hypothetical protein
MSIYYRFDSILPCISFHLAFNAGNYLWERLLNLPDGTSGYAVSLAIGTSIVLLSLLSLFLKKKRL